LKHADIRVSWREGVAHGRRPTYAKLAAAVGELRFVRHLADPGLDFHLVTLGDRLSVDVVGDPASQLVSKCANWSTRHSEWNLALAICCREIAHQHGRRVFINNLPRQATGSDRVACRQAMLSIIIVPSRFRRDAPDRPGSYVAHEIVLDFGRHAKADDNFFF